MYFATLGVIASSASRLAVEIRHLQRTEVLEAEEFFSEGQRAPRHAAQAQPGCSRRTSPACPHGARLCDAALEKWRSGTSATFPIPQPSA